MIELPSCVLSNGSVVMLLPVPVYTPVHSYSMTGVNTPLGTDNEVASHVNVLEEPSGTGLSISLIMGIVGASIMLM